MRDRFDGTPPRELHVGHVRLTLSRDTNWPGHDRSVGMNDMQAVIHRAYGAPEAVLSVQTVPKPVPKDDEVVVQVRAASMHPDIWHVIVGYPLVLRMMGNGIR